MGVLHSLPAHLLMTSPHTLHLAMTQLQHGCCIHQPQSLLGNSNESARGHYYPRVSTRCSPGPPQAAASRVTLALPQCTENPMREIDEPDWKVLRRAHPLALQRDREMARLFDNPRRSHALTMLAQIRSQGLLTEDEFSSLSPETRGAIQMLLGAG